MNEDKFKSKVKGKAYLVGSGPGNWKLLTLKAKEVLESCDCVIYDRLVNYRVLEKFCQGKEKIFVGKSPEKHTYLQKEINELILKKVLDGKIVVRLKGGDPFIFGRGGEEASFLAEKGILVEVVPGISSATSAPLYAGFPLTHRKYSSSFLVLTGHEDPQKISSYIDLKEAALGNKTLVILMGVSNLDKIINCLIENGMPVETPAAVIQNCSLSNQKVVLAYLKDIAKEAKKQEIVPPAVIIIGKVVKLREKLSWFESKLLYGRKILISRPICKNDTLIDRLEDLGAEVHHHPLIKIEKINNNIILMKEEIKRIDSYRWLVFTSVNGVDIFFENLFEMGLDARVLGNLKVAAIGSSTALRLKSFSLLADVIPERYTTLDLANKLEKMVNKEDRIFMVRSEGANKILTKKLENKVKYVNDLHIYRYICNKSMLEACAEKIDSIDFDLAALTSPLIAKNYSMLKGMVNKKLPPVVCIGPPTKKKAQKLHLDVRGKANICNSDGLVEVINYIFSN